MTLRGKALCGGAAALPLFWMGVNYGMVRHGHSHLMPWLSFQVFLMVYLLPSFGIQKLLGMVFGAPLIHAYGWPDMIFSGIVYGALIYLLLGSMVRQCSEKDS